MAHQLFNLNMIWALIQALVVLSLLRGTRGYEGTTSFEPILIAHPSPTICPSVTFGSSWVPDANYIACCDQWYGSYTLTTGLGPGSKPAYACCRSGYTCTPPVSLMKDWSVDSNGDIQTLDLSNPPTPAAAPAVTTPATYKSTGTVSRPGASAIATSSGVIVYVYSSNENNNNNEVNIGNGASSSPSAGAIAGITVACTVVTTIVGVIGLWYARKRRARKSKAPEAPPLPQSPPPSGYEYPYTASSYSQSPSQPQRVELEGRWQQS